MRALRIRGNKEVGIHFLNEHLQRSGFRFNKAKEGIQTILL